MAEILPFQPYRYTAKAGSLADLVTQPYDKISPEMQARYLTRSPHNFAHVILGARLPTDTDNDNVYTRAAARLREWIAGGILAPDPEPGFYPYFQEFTVPDTGERVTRQGFICLGPAEDYSSGVVHPHEQTLSGPKKDRLELMRHTRAHTGQLFLMYSDPECRVDAILADAARAEPLAEVTDEYDVIHRMWKISDPVATAEISRLMADKKLLIADGHHRYETALAFRRENPDLPQARHVMMTLVNMDSPGVKILATHRLVSGLEGFDAETFLAQARRVFHVTPMESEQALRSRWEQAEPEKIRIAVATGHGPEIHLLEAERGTSDLDVSVLHDRILAELLGISAKQVREQKYLRYIRGLSAAIEQVREGSVQAAFLLEPTTMEQVARVSFSGGVMPQKSTDFYPKLLAGLTVYKMDD